MKRIPDRLVKDYLIVGCAFACILFFLHPLFLTPDRRAVPLIVFKLVHALSFLSTLLLSEMVVTCLFKNPFSYASGISEQLKHFALCAVVGVPLFNALLNQSNTIMMFDFQKYYYAWFDADGSFTLKWYLKTLDLCVLVAFIMVAAMMALSRVRHLQNNLRELALLNELLEREQEEMRIRPSDETVAEKILLQGNSRDSLMVNPFDILYIESVGNYLSIAYFIGTALCQKRLRCSLKEAEEVLEAFPFIVHIHRAFLINIHFITQVSGNSAGCKVSMFSTDKVFPVSKANVPKFRDKIKALGGELR